MSKKHSTDDDATAESAAGFLPEKNELATVEKSPLATRQPEPSVGALMQAVIEKGITPDTVGVMERLCELRRQVKADDARAAFAAAFVELQAEMPVIHATKTIPAKDGSIRSAFAPYEEIMRQVAPLLKKHGFTVSFSKKFNEGRVSAFCTLMHCAGHEKTNEYQVRIGQGPPGCSESQADGAAHMYAMRGALRDALGITVAGLDNDAREVGPAIEWDKAENLRQRVLETKSSEAAFLKFAGATSYETIPANRWNDLDALLRAKEGRQRVNPQ
jgi:hypothetical protein